jgi:hypothetical protein
MQLEHAQWMSWEAGIDVVGVTRPGLAMPNVLVHVARMVHTPVGSAPSGMVLWQPDPDAAPLLVAFVSTDPEVGSYFGSRIFAGTPFEPAPALDAALAVIVSDTSINARVQAGGHLFEVELTDLGAPYVIHRPPASMTPFVQQGIEAAAGNVRLKVDGAPIDVMPLEVGIAGGPGAVWAPCGLYAR